MTDALVTDQPAAWQQLLEDACARVRVGTSLEQRGTLTRLAGLVLEASGLRIPVGS
ncbi:MAG TPA: flagellum-specific ATP synthase FliI, partial [Burkholderiaceae bacterium]|nr:flagellum-specific ATP synthase FliI [Burkholderiaceae bacterium]